MEPMLFLVALIMIPVFFMLSQQKADRFQDKLKHEVERIGGTVLHSERMFWSRGPFWVKGKGQHIVKVVYRDSKGQLRQLWGRTGVFEDDLVWDHDDGEYNV